MNEEPNSPEVKPHLTYHGVEFSLSQTLMVRGWLPKTGAFLFGLWKVIEKTTIVRYGIFGLRKRTVSALDWTQLTSTEDRGLVDKWIEYYSEKVLFQLAYDYSNDQWIIFDQLSFMRQVGKE